MNTRGIILLDEPDDRLYFFVTSSESGGKIDYKITSMSNPSFVDGDGDFFIKIPADAHINNPTSTKQNITGSTGLLVVGSDDTSQFYLHNFITPSATNAPTIFSFTPSSGSEGTSVVITGAGFGGATAVKFNGMNASGFAVDFSTQITAIAPESVTGGPIAVITSGGTATSPTNFTVTGSTRIKDITFEGGSIVELAAGFDTTSGAVKLETASPIKGADSMTIATGSSYGQQNYVATDEIFISLYLRIAAVPAGQVRLVRISDQGISVGALTLEATGKLTLRNFLTSLGATTAALKPGTMYRIAIHQKKGTGSNAILEGFLATGDANFTTPFARNTTQTFITQADSIQIGATTSMGGTITFDDIRLDAGAMPGPPLP
jgi:hypothetical protein